MNGVNARNGLSWADLALLTLFFLGLYTSIEVRLTPTIPIPAVLCGIAGGMLVFRRRHQIAPTHAAGLIMVVLVYLGSIFAAHNLGFIGKRFTGLVQLTYSFVLAYALYLTVLLASRRQMAALFLTFCVAIVIGCLWESYGGLRPLSDAARATMFERGIYESDLRDQLLYGRIRPKLFTSEPSAVTSSYTLFAFGWLIASQWRWKIAGYVALFVAGVIAMPGPTLLLMMVMLAPYYLIVATAAEQAKEARFTQRAWFVALSCMLVAGFFVIGPYLYAERFNQILQGQDPSFFFRVIGPALVAFDVIEKHPWAGTGLTGEQFIADQVMNVFVRSPQFSAAWSVSKVSEVLTNYFWLHWIYLGLVWGMAALAAVTAWMRIIGVGTSSIVFCWLIWAVLGQASGAYVGPRTWVILLLTAALAVKAHREQTTQSRLQTPPPMPLAWQVAARLGAQRP